MKRVAIVRQILLKLHKKTKEYTENTEKINRKEYTEIKKSKQKGIYRKDTLITSFYVFSVFSM